MKALESGLISKRDNHYIAHEYDFSSFLKDNNRENLKRKLADFFKRKYKFAIEIIFQKATDGIKYIVKKGISKKKEHFDFRDYYIGFNNEPEEYLRAINRKIYRSRQRS